jgi:hypothetical protein
MLLKLRLGYRSPALRAAGVETYIRKRLALAKYRDKLLLSQKQTILDIAFSFRFSLLHRPVECAILQQPSGV